MTGSPSPGSRCRSRWWKRCSALTCAAAPASSCASAHAATALAQDDDGVTVTVSDEAGAGYLIRARYVLGCDGATGVDRDQVGARYVGRSDPRPNFNLVFRAPVAGHAPRARRPVLGGRRGPAATAGLIGRLDLAGTWWAILPGIERGLRDGARLRR